MTLPTWSSGEVEEDVALAAERAGERWLSARTRQDPDTLRRHARILSLHRRQIHTLLFETGNLSHLEGLTSEGALSALRRLADIPVSKADFAFLLRCDEATSGVPLQAEVNLCRELLQSSSDPQIRRLVQGRESLVGSRRVQFVTSWARSMSASTYATLLRTSQSAEQQAEALSLMTRAGLVPRELTTPLVDINSLAVGEYTPREVKIRSVFGVSKADIAVRVSREVMVPIECKRSGSETNSHKRLVKEVGDKRTEWESVFGDKTLPVALLGGVYSARDVLTAQDKGIYIVWEHNLAPLEAILAEGALRSALEQDEMNPVVLVDA